MESQSYFFPLSTFILMKGQAKFLCLLSISAASQQTTEQATEELTNLFIKKKQNHFFLSQLRYAKRSAFERMQRASVHTLSYLAACSDLDSFNIFFSV